jgi:ubiquitin-protein ligase
VVKFGGQPFIEEEVEGGCVSGSAQSRPVVLAQKALSYWVAQRTDSDYFRNAELVEGDLQRWKIEFLGLEGGHLAGVALPAELRFPGEFPWKPPRVLLQPAPWHPNVRWDTGEVCASLLKQAGPNDQEGWLLIHDLEALALSVLSALEWPSTNWPANVEAAAELRASPEAFWKKLRGSVSR